METSARAAIALALTLVAAPAAAQLVDQPAARCQSLIGKWGSKFKHTALSASRKCYEQLLKGSSCDTGARIATIVAAEDHFANVIRRSCTSTDLFSPPPAGLGFAQNCVLEPLGIEPAEQSCAQISVTDGESLGHCLACWKLAELNELLAIGYPCLLGAIPAGSDLDCGTPPPGPCPTDSKATSCVRNIAKAGQKFLLAKELALEKCLNLVLRGRSSGPCPDAKAQDTITKQQAKLATVALHCRVTPPWWDVCPEMCTQTTTTPADMATCMGASAEAITDEVVCQQYPLAGAHGIACPAADEN